MLVKIVEEILTQTPIWVWFLLGYLLKRGLSLRKESKVSLAKSWMMPVIFMVWGLERIFVGFEHILPAFLIYGGVLVIGTLAGYRLYQANTSFYWQNNQIMRKGSTLPLVVMMTNFVVKYVLNVLLSIKPYLLADFSFELIYAAISSFTVGLFIGGILNTIKNLSKMR